MKTVFLLNPAAGRGRGLDKLKDKITRVAESSAIDYEVHITEFIGDAENYVRKVSRENPDEKCLFVACGGDGTFNEILNGASGNKNAVLSIVPIGTGNDFVRNFPDCGDFTDIEKLLAGHEVSCDAIKYSGKIGGIVQERYCGNMINIGFDSNVVDLTQRLKTKPLVSGTNAYILSVLIVLIKKAGANLRIEADGELIHEGKLLLSTVANGAFCGGGMKSNPLAAIRDGKMDINIAGDLGRLRFLSLFPKYSKGEILDVRGIDKYLKHKKAEKLVITPLDGMMRLCSDGETGTAEKIELEVVPDFFRFRLPLR